MKNYAVRCVRALCSFAVIFCVCVSTFFALTAAALSLTGIAETDFAEVAKGEIGYTAADTSKYIQWTADKNADNAAAFVSWCAYTAGVSTDIIPRDFSNSAMLGSFRSRSVFSASAYLGGSKKPTVGSVIFLAQNAGDYNSLSGIGIVTGISGMTVSFVTYSSGNSVVSEKLSIYNTHILGFAFPDYGASPVYKTGNYQTNAIMKLRCGPDTSYQQVKDSAGEYVLISLKATVTVTEINNNWGYITYNGNNGWFCLDWSDYIGEVLTPSGDEWLIADVSQYQPEAAINWNSLKSSGISGVILRIGGRYYGEKSNHLLYADDEFAIHYKGAKKAGLSVGLYFFSAAYTEERAREEAQFVLDELSKDNYELDLPVFIDMEDIQNDYKPHYAAGKQVCTLVTDTFCKVIEEAGYYAGVYCSKDFAEVLLDPAVFTGRAVWIAQYNDECTYNGSYHMWQYTDKGSVSGYNGPLDLSRCYFDFPTFIKSKGYNGFTATGESTGSETWSVSKAPSCSSTGRESVYDKAGKETASRLINKTEHTVTQAVVIGKQFFAGIAGTDAEKQAQIVQLLAGRYISTSAGYTLIPYAKYVSSADLQAAFSNEGGCILEYCTSCSIITETEYTPPAGKCVHKNSTEKTEQESTCSAEGIIGIYCPDCKFYLSSRLMPTSEHTPAQLTQTATCTSEGSITTKCKVCGEILTYRSTGLAEHVGEWHVEKPALALVAGTEACTCTVCGQAATRATEPLMLADIDRDSSISAADARSVLRIAVKLDAADEAGTSIADVDNDKAVTSEDARLVLRISVKLDDYNAIVKRFYS